MPKRRKADWRAASGIVALVCLAFGYLLIGGKDGGAVHAGSGVTTEQVAADAGAEGSSDRPQ